MRDFETEGKLQVIAAVALLKFSRLVEWEELSAEFIAASRHSFESAWRGEIDPVFGRLICWINFSAGAEFLAKGVCLLNHVEIRRPKPTGTCFGTLGDLTEEKAPKDALVRLFKTVRAGDAERELVLGSYKYLASQIRNRDAHAYVPNVRDDHFHEVGERFVLCFNLLCSWLPTGPRSMSNWAEHAQQLVDDSLT